MSTDSVNPRAVLSQARPAIGIYSRHRHDDVFYLFLQKQKSDGIGTVPIPVCLRASYLLFYYIGRRSIFYHYLYYLIILLHMNLDVMYVCYSQHACSEKISC